MANPRVIIIGGGFGGLNAAKSLKKADVDLLVIDKTNHHCFQPLLYQVATAALSSGNIAFPIREVLRDQANTQVIMANVDSIDKNNHTVFISNGETIEYDYLIVATGATHSYFGHPEWEAYAPGLKTVIDAAIIREKILLAFELGERCEDLKDAQKYLRFVIVGAGPTGVEMAGAIAEIARKTLFKNFRKIKPEQSKIYLIEGLGQVLSTYPPKLGSYARRALEKMGVTVMTDTKVTKVTAEGVFIGDEFIEAANIIWAAGNEASPLLKTLDVALDRQGRALVEPDLSIPGHPDVFVIGDAACLKDDKGVCLPGLAPVALQEGRYVARLIAKKIPKKDRKPFRYFDKGTMATIGKAKAVAVMKKLTLSGYIAWLAWGFIHILYLISFQNKFIVMTQWMFMYLTGKRQMRLISRPIGDDSDIHSIKDNPEEILEHPKHGE